MSSAPRSIPRRLAGAALLVAAIALAAAFLPLEAWLEELLAWGEEIGPWGAALGGLLYLPACVLCLPCTPITLATGFVFGHGPTFLAILVGSNLGSALTFVLGRTLLRAPLERWAARRPRFQSFDRRVATGGLRVVLLTRLAPIFPYNLLNYALGITRLRFRDAVLGTFLGMLPAIWLNSYLGSAARSLSAALRGEVETGPGQVALLVAGLLASVVVVVLLTRAARRALAETVPVEAVEASDTRGENP